MAFDNVTLVELNVPYLFQRDDETRERETEQEESGGGLPVGKLLVGLLVVGALAFLARRKLKSRREDDEEPETEVEYPAADVEVDRPTP